MKKVFLFFAVAAAFASCAPKAAPVEPDADTTAVVLVDSLVVADSTVVDSTIVAE